VRRVRNALKAVFGNVTYVSDLLLEEDEDDSLTSTYDRKFSNVSDSETRHNNVSETLVAPNRNEEISLMEAHDEDADSGALSNSIDFRPYFRRVYTSYVNLGRRYDGAEDILTTAGQLLFCFGFFVRKAAVYFLGPTAYGGAFSLAGGMYLSTREHVDTLTSDHSASKNLAKTTLTKGTGTKKTLAVLEGDVSAVKKAEQVWARAFPMRASQMESDTEKKADFSYSLIASFLSGNEEDGWVRHRICQMEHPLDRLDLLLADPSVFDTPSDAIFQALDICYPSLLFVENSAIPFRNYTYSHTVEVLDNVGSLWIKWESVLWKITSAGRLKDRNAHGNHKETQITQGSNNDSSQTQEMRTQENATTAVSTPENATMEFTPEDLKVFEGFGLYLPSRDSFLPIKIERRYHTVYVRDNEACEWERTPDL